VNECDSSLLRVIASISKTLRSQQKKFVALNASKSISSFLKSNGLDQSLVCVDSLKEATQPSNGRASAFTVDVNFIRPFVEGSLETLKVQCQIESQSGSMFLKGKSPLGYEVAIAGVIGLSSKAFTGSVAICFTETLFLKLMSNMLGEAFTAITPDLEDGAGELVNIIFGHAKRVLNTQGYAIEKAIPTVVRGKGVEVKHITPHPTIILPFQTTDGPFHIEIGVEQASS
jgi:chemotaxis protein CheX